MDNNHDNDYDNDNDNDNNNYDIKSLKNHCFCCNTKYNINNDYCDHYGVLIFENNKILIHCGFGSSFDEYSYRFGFYETIESNQIYNLLDKSHRFYVNLDYTNKDLIVSNSNNKKKILTLRDALTNFINNYKLHEKNKSNQENKSNENDYLVCDNCIGLLYITGVTTNERIFYDNTYFFCCIDCLKPTNEKNNYRFLMTNLIGNKYGNFLIDYNNIPKEDDHIITADSGFCENCFEKYKNKPYLYRSEQYYYNLLKESKTIKCCSCNYEQEYSSQESNNDAITTENFSTVICFNNTENSQTKNKLIIVSKININTWQTNNKYDNFVFDYVTFSCSNKFSLELKNTFINKYLSFIKEILPGDLCNIIIDYYVLYYNICDNCFNEKKKSENILCNFEFFETQMQYYNNRNKDSSEKTIDELFFVNYDILNKQSHLFEEVTNYQEYYKNSTFIWDSKFNCSIKSDSKSDSNSNS